MKPFEHQQHNRVAWDRMAQTKNRFARPAQDADFIKPLASVDGPGWLGPNIFGKRVLCLAAGGGRQGPIYAAAGAEVTVVDISPAMLELDRAVARRRNLHMRVVETTMEDLSMFSQASFDIVIQPVSTCYVPELQPVYAQVARVLTGGGVYVSQHKQPVSLQTSIEPTTAGYVLKWEGNRTAPLPECRTSNFVREQGTREFIHSLDHILGGLCRAGFVLEDLIEPAHADPAAEAGTFGHRSRFVAPYLRIKARRTGSDDSQGATRLWSPS